jgi:hypothetical protein
VCSGGGMTARASRRVAERRSSNGPATSDYQWAHERNALRERIDRALSQRIADVQRAWKREQRAA